MLTLEQFQQIEQFVADVPEGTHVYGHAVVYHEDSGKLVPMGTLVLNNLTEDEDKPGNYFIYGENIGGYNYALIGHIEIHKGTETLICTD